MKYSISKFVHNNHEHVVSKISFVLLSFGAVVSVILWVAVGFHVGLQDSELAVYLISAMLHCLFACLFVVVVVLETCM